VQREILRGILMQLANTLREGGAIDERENFSDVTCTSATGNDDGIGQTRPGNDVKILVIVGRHGLPLSTSTHAGNLHEVMLVQLRLNFYILEAKPKHLDDDLKKGGVNWKRRPWFVGNITPPTF
jgi:hypothetical protein